MVVQMCKYKLIVMFGGKNIMMQKCWYKSGDDLLQQVQVDCVGVCAGELGSFFFTTSKREQRASSWYKCHGDQRWDTGTKILQILREGIRAKGFRPG